MNLLFPAQRQQVLAALLLQPGHSLHLRELARLRLLPPPQPQLRPLLPQWQPWQHLLLAAPRAMWPCLPLPSCWPTTTCLLATWLAPAKMAA